MRPAWLIALALCLVAPGAAPAADEVKPIRVLLVLGGCCHDYQAQQHILKEGISARAHVEVTISYDPDKGTRHLNPVYEDADWAEAFDVVIHDECSADVKDPEVIERILKPHREGLPAVVLHCGMHSYRGEGFPKTTAWFDFTGLASTGHGPQTPISLAFVDKQHPITKGAQDWTTIREELYNNSAGTLLDTAKPLARGKQTVRRRGGKESVEDSVVVWTNMYNGKSRVFATTLGHNNETVADPRYLDLVTRGLLWSVDKLDEKHLKPEAAVKAAQASQAAEAKRKAAAEPQPTLAK
ncbi:MAG: ThuA domain-containing protein [Pirellulales bacterium]